MQLGLDPADDRELVHHRRMPGQVLADGDAGHLGLDRFELALDLGWGIRFHVVQSICAPPPRNKIMMTDCLRPAPPGESARKRRTSASVIPPMDRAPTCKGSRRVVPS